MQRNIDLNEQLLVAVEIGNYQEVESLLSKGAEINYYDYNYYTPLHLAAQDNHVDIAKLLLDKGAKFMFHSLWETPLTIAIRNSNLEIARLFLNQANKLKLSFPKNQKQELFDQFRKVANVREDNKLSLIVNLSDSTRKTELHKAIDVKNIKIVKLLLDSGALINAKDQFGGKPLHYSVLKQTKEITRLLLEYGADVNLGDNGRTTVLHFAAKQGNEETVQLLLEHGADVNLQDGEGKTALHYAAKSGYKEIVGQIISFIIRNEGIEQAKLYFLADVSRYNWCTKLIKKGLSFKNDSLINCALFTMLEYDKDSLEECRENFLLSTKVNDAYNFATQLANAGIVNSFLSLATAKPLEVTPRRTAQ
ncbi:MAG: ankyrin repeat domain-containing protein [Rickettsiaceae bacterium H1]|nr:ankyrin repeat domain-containing protein [Rickettsiaceae bacterium H1]